MDHHTITRKSWEVLVLVLSHRFLPFPCSRLPRLMYVYLHFVASPVTSLTEAQSAYR